VLFEGATALEAQENLLSLPSRFELDGLV
jgi:hypothetical protein